MDRPAAEWMQAARRGDSDAWRRLQEAYGPLVRGQIAGRGFTAEDREDVEALVWQKVWSARDRVDPSRPLGPWLTVIARHTAVDWQRRQQGWRWEPLREGDDLPAPGVPAEGREALLSALEALPAEERRLLTSVYFEGLSIQEAARARGSSPGAAKVALHRARRRLRDQLRLRGLFGPSL